MTQGTNTTIYGEGADFPPLSEIVDNFSKIIFFVVSLFVSIHSIFDAFWTNLMNYDLLKGGVHNITILRSSHFMVGKYFNCKICNWNFAKILVLIHRCRKQSNFNCFLRLFIVIHCFRIIKYVSHYLYPNNSYAILKNIWIVFPLFSGIMTSWQIIIWSPKLCIWVTFLKIDHLWSCKETGKEEHTWLIEG